MHESAIVTVFDACMGKFDGSDGWLRSFFAKSFEPACEELDECYKDCIDKPTFDECNLEFREKLEEICEFKYPKIFNHWCHKKARKWAEYMEYYGEDYYEEVKCSS